MFSDLAGVAPAVPPAGLGLDERDIPMATVLRDGGSGEHGLAAAVSDLPCDPGAGMRHTGCKSSLRSRFQWFPSLVIGLGCLVMVSLVVLSIESLLRARRAVRADWGLAVGVGLVASTALFALAVGLYFWDLRRRTETSRLAIIVPVVLGV